MMKAPSWRDHQRRSCGTVPEESAFARFLDVKTAELARDPPRPPVADRLPVDLNYRQHEGRGSGEQGLAGLHRFRHREGPLLDGETFLLRKVQHGAARHAGEDVVRRRWKFLPRNPLVVVQIAFSLALLTAAALFIRGASKAASIDSGLRPGASFLLEVDASLAGYEPKRAEELYQNLSARLASLPAVEHASISSTVPFGIIQLDRNVQRAGVRSGSDAKPATPA